MSKPRPLRTRLLLLVAGSIVPMLLLAVGNAWLGYRAERERLQTATVSLARSMVLSVEREVQRALGGLSALALSRRLCAGDLKDFRDQLQTFVNQQYPGTNALLSRRDGQQLINLYQPPGEPLPRRRNRELVERTFATGQPAVSDVYEGSFRGRLVSFEVPVTCGGRVEYNLALTPRFDTFKTVLELQRPPPDWAVLLVDSKGAIIASVHDRDDPDMAVLTPAEPLRMDGNEGLLQLAVSSGTTNAFSFSRAPDTGWSVVIGRPLRELSNDLNRSLIALSLASVAMLAAAMGIAWAVSRSITRPIAKLGRLAHREQAAATELAPSGLLEVDAIADRLNCAMRQLEEADHRKDEFIAILAHELRNPISPVKNALGFLQKRESLSEDGVRLIGIAHRQLRNIERLIQDLLEISRIGQGKVALDLQAIDLRDPIRTAVESVAESYARKHQQLSVLLPDQPLRIQGDPLRLAQVFNNLLDNASKYTQDGGAVRIEASREGPTWKACVIDNGSGMEASKVGQVFEMFWQIGSEQRSTRSGLGIGLALVRQLVEMHGGAVTAHSDGLGAGSCFTVRLPMAMSKHAGARA